MCWRIHSSLVADDVVELAALLETVDFAEVTAFRHLRSELECHLYAPGLRQLPGACIILARLPREPRLGRVCDSYIPDLADFVVALASVSARNIGFF